jgi:Bacterial Ig-like domain (group 2).
MKTIVAAVIALTVLGVAACTGADSPTVAGDSFDSCIQEPFVTPAAATLHVGDTITLSVKGGPCVGDGGTVQPRWTWRSSDSTVATVDSSSGLVRAQGKGSTTIISTLVGEASVNGAGSITVVP